MDLHRRVATDRRQRHSTKPKWLKAVALIIAIAAFFMIGYLIAALSIPIWAKVLLCSFVAIVALVMSCLMTDLLNA